MSPLHSWNMHLESVSRNRQINWTRALGIIKVATKLDENDTDDLLFEID